MQTKKQKLLQIAAIISVLCAVSCIFLMVFVNDKFTNLAIFFGVLTTIFTTNARNSETKKKEKELSEKDQFILKILMWIAIALVIAGIVFAFFYV